MKFEEWKKLNEIGDRIKTPKILKRFNWPFDTKGNRGSKTFFYDIEMEKDVYQVVIQILTNGDKSSIKIDFGRIVEGNLSMDMTNSGIMLELMSNLVGTIKEWLQDYKGNETIYSIIVGAKMEHGLDFRRAKIYDAYLKNNFKKMGIQVREEFDITDEWRKEFPDDNQSKMTKYRLEPISLDTMRKAISNRI